MTYLPYKNARQRAGFIPALRTAVRALACAAALLAPGGMPGAPAATGAAATADAPAPPKRPSKAPFRVLHGNDTTNATNCLQAKAGVRPPMSDQFIRATVTEAAGRGIDVHMIQPGRGWVPWWQSDALPVSEQLAWKAAQKIRPADMEIYLKNGGDVMRVFVDECRRTGQRPFASFRMNDQHHLHPADRGRMPEPGFSRKAGVCRFYVENPRWRIGQDGVATLMGSLSMNFAVPEVREFRLAQIRELIDRHDIDGFELDFVRHPELFNQKDTTSGQRARILTGLVRQVRAALDAKGARAGRYLWLGLRIPGYPETFDRLGIDLPALAEEAGADIINASAHYYTDAQMPIARLRAMLPDDVALYAELHFAAAKGPAEDTGGGKTTRVHRRCTPLQLWTAAHLARRRGADGVSTFNFQYYRGTYNKGDVAGSSIEPPYEVFKTISDLDWLSQQPQHYVAADIGSLLRLNRRPLHSSFKAGSWKAVPVDMAPPAGGWRADGKLRIKARSPMDGAVWFAKLNGVPLAPSGNVGDIFPNPYPDALGSPGDYRAWRVPAALLKDGENSFEFSYKNGPKTVSLCYMDVALPNPAPAIAGGPEYKTTTGEQDKPF
ncbi:MAG: hypothetical protein LBC18_13950 [Opitutaceae bacterium]|jgi:hypothetical protein|nr:hypothetical protein [Opitutaceae bacterium]